MVLTTPIPSTTSLTVSAVANFAPGYRLLSPATAPSPGPSWCWYGEHLLLDEARQPVAAATVEARLGPAAAMLLIGTLVQPSADGGEGQTEEVRMRLWPAPRDGEWPAPLAGLHKGDFRQLSGCWPAAAVAAVARGRALAHWWWQHRYCGACATPLQALPEEPGLRCPACGTVHYPRLSPVCIGLIRRGRELLLARSPHFPPGVYSALAGFVEAGESLEDCLRREIREEVGLEVGAIRYHSSQFWPYPGQLMIGFVADYASGELQPRAGEIEAAAWFTPEALPPLPHPSTLAWQMLHSELGGAV